MGSSPVWGAVIVAAGRGERFGAGDKTLAPLGDKPVLARSIEALLADPRISSLVVAASRTNLDACRQLLARLESPGATCAVCLGGATRSESVRAGLARLPRWVTHVAVHDAARALVSHALVTAVLDAAEEAGAAVPVVPVASTLLIAGIDGRVAGTLDRGSAREAQTPQAARRDLLEASLAAYPDETDESTALFRSGVPVAMVEGDRSNIKITVADDLGIAAALLAARTGPR